MLRAWICTVALGAQLGWVAAAQFAFAVLGDTPYTQEEEERFPELLAAMSREDLAFVVHVGDFKGAWRECSDQLYRQRRGWFELSRHPFVYVPGDNEWTDCARPLFGARDPLERLQKLREIFFAEPWSLGQRRLPLARQSDGGRHGYPEHARWEHGGVLFVTLNAPGPDNNARMPEEQARRSEAMRAWLDEAFALARGRGLGALVVLMQADPWTGQGRARRGFAPLAEALAAHARSFPGEVLLVHGDAHRYRVDRPLRDPRSGAVLPNLTRVGVFGSPHMNWVRVRVTEQEGRVKFEVTPGG